MTDCFLGIDLGSSFTKLCVVNGEGDVLFRTVFPTLSRDKESLQQNLDHVHHIFPIQSSCATGYGRMSFEKARSKKTELVCSAVGASKDFPYRKTVIDIGGEDIKVIVCEDAGKVEHFYMSDKCAAGTGAFLMEVAEKAELEIGEMSRLASSSSSKRELNSFCTVFAKTEILQWKFADVPVEDIARGIYLSLVSRIMKLSYDPGFPVILCGGVIGFHPYVGELLKERLPVEVVIPEEPQYVSAYGASLIARRETEKLVAT
ncbi:MAG: acyl-CoA dehydratase activase [Candidatus Neomarinimicrobiota bacterium]